MVPFCQEKDALTLLILLIHRLWSPFFFIGDFAEYRGFSSDVSFYMLAIMNAMSMMGRLVLFIADKVGR